MTTLKTKNELEPLVSTLTTPEELENAPLIDQEKLQHGLENRTACCRRLVETDCANSTCGHPPHENACRGQQDLPCSLYEPRTDLLFHVECPGRLRPMWRSRNLAEHEAWVAWDQAVATDQEEQQQEA